MSFYFNTKSFLIFGGSQVVARTVIAHLLDTVAHLGGSEDFGNHFAPALFDFFFSSYESVSACEDVVLS
jgi:hypothetical protein